MLTLTWICCDRPMLTGMASTRRRTRSATASPKVGGQLGRTMANSSPPTRATSVHRPHAVEQRRGHGLEHQVAAGMAVGVVDALEVVDVQHQQQRRLAGAGHAVDLARQRQLEAAAVGQAGERIAAGQVAPANRSATAARPRCPACPRAARGPTGAATAAPVSSCKALGAGLDAGVERATRGPWSGALEGRSGGESSSGLRAPIGRKCGARNRACSAARRARARQEQRLQVAEEVEAALGRPQPLRVALDQAALLRPARSGRVDAPTAAARCAR